MQQTCCAATAQSPPAATAMLPLTAVCDTSPCPPALIPGPTVPTASAAAIRALIGVATPTPALVIPARVVVAAEAAADDAADLAELGRPRAGAELGR